MAHYNYDQGTSYPHCYNPYGDEGYFLARPRPKKENQLYSSSLLSLDRRTKMNLEHLKGQLVKEDPCYAFGMEHWHSDSKKGSTRNDTYELFTEASWQDPKTIFSNTGLKTLHSHKPTPHDQEEKDTPNPFCYLCTTLEQHQRHLAKKGMRLKEKKKPKPRVAYIAPPPLVKKKKEVQEEKEEILYKITVKTAKRADAGTSANAFIQLLGNKGVMKKRALTRKRLGNFCFGSGTVETFHFKGPNIGAIKCIKLEHDGLEKKHGWLVEEVEVANLSSGEMWLFPCGQWLSLFLGDFAIKRTLSGALQEKVEKEYEIRVFTANEAFAGTDANVYISLHGKKGSSRRMHLKSKAEDTFEKGKEDVFHQITDDIGHITSIKIEHDNTGRGPGWRLEKVNITDLETGKQFVFPCGEWLAEDEGDGKLCRILYPRGKTSTSHSGQKRKESSGPKLRYRVKVLTGGVSCAGTDARVYLLMTGKLGVAEEVELQNGRDCFEKNQTDVFDIHTEDVGDLKKIIIRHDNTSLGAGWFLEELVVQRFFSQAEVAERLGMMKAEIDENVMRRASQAGVEVSRDSPSPRSLKHTKSKSLSDSDNEDDNERGKSRHGDKSHRLSSDERRQRKTDKKRNPKKTFSYNGIRVDVTDESDSSDEEVRDRHSKHKKKSKKKSKDSDTETSDSSDEDIRGNISKQKKKQKKHDSNSDNSDADSKKQRRVKFSVKQSGKMLRRQSSRLALDDSDDEVGRSSTGRIPHYDEYLFKCHRWLADDEDDGLISRTLKPSSITTFYKLK